MISAALLYYYAPHNHFAFLIYNFSFKRDFPMQSKDTTLHGLGKQKSSSAFALADFFYLSQFFLPGYWERPLPRSSMALLRSLQFRT